MTAGEVHSEPGWVNAHTHLYSGLAPLGLPEPSPQPGNFVEILERLWWKLDRALDEKSLRAAARLYVAEALLAGTTSLVDHHESPEFIDGSLDVLAGACTELGMRALLCYGASERNRGIPEARSGLAECRRFARENDSPLLVGLVGLHASFTVSDELISEAAALSRELGTVLHVHVAEDTADVTDAQKRGYQSPLERLFDLGALPPGSILAHGVHLSEEEVREAERHDLWLIQNPRSNQANGVGYARSLHASTRVALGTDGFPSDMRTEYDMLERLAREDDGEMSWPGDLSARLSARLSAGGRLVAERFGAPATALRMTGDEVMLAPDQAGGRPRVVRVTVAGETVVDDGRLVRADLEEIRANAAEQAAALTARMEAL
jgi:cytosine/adenosine deaminase-related metal-dependent hydrolase